MVSKKLKNEWKFFSHVALINFQCEIFPKELIQSSIHTLLNILQLHFHFIPVSILFLSLILIKSDFENSE